MKPISWSTAVRIDYRLNPTERELERNHLNPNLPLNHARIELILAEPHIDPHRSLAEVLEATRDTAHKQKQELNSLLGGRTAREDTSLPPARSVNTSVFLNIEDYKTAADAAASVNLPLSEFVRRQVTKRDVRELDYRDNLEGREKFLLEHFA